MDNVISDVSIRVFKAHPYVFLFVMGVSGATIGYSYQVFAEKLEVEKEVASLNFKVDGITDRVKDIDTKLDRSFLELQLNDIDREIYSLEHIISTIEATPRDAERLDRQRIRRNEIQREIARLPN
jgi:predicted  nucleic acid-binding Zn-ribbon protein